MNKRVSVNESTEVSIPLKTLLSVIVGLLMASWYIFETQEKIQILKTELKLLRKTVEKHPDDLGTDIAVIKNDIRNLKEHLKEHKHHKQ